jgi:hypothetical protein
VSAEPGQLACARKRPSSRVVGRPCLGCLSLLFREDLEEGVVTQYHLFLGAYLLTSDLQQAWNRRPADHSGVRPGPALSVPAPEHTDGDLASWVPHCLRAESHDSRRTRCASSWTTRKSCSVSRKASLSRTAFANDSPGNMSNFGLCRLWRECCWCSWVSLSCGRHNQRASRNASRESGGR